MALSHLYRQLCLPTASTIAAGLLPALTHPRSTQLFSKATQKLNPSTSKKPPPQAQSDRGMLDSAPSKQRCPRGDAGMGMQRWVPSNTLPPEGGVIRLWYLRPHRAPKVLEEPS